MKITTQTPQPLVISEEMGSNLLLGGTLAGIGMIGVLVGMISIAGTFFGLIVLGAGVAVLMSARASTAVFDRARRTLTITRRSIRGSTHEEMDLHSITELGRERALADTDDRLAMRVYRMAFVTRDGSRHPWAIYNDADSEARSAVAAACEFIGLAAPARATKRTTAPADRTHEAALRRSAVRPTITASSQRRAKSWPARVVGLIMIVAGILFIRGEVTQLRVEHQRLAAYVPVSARVLSSKVASWYVGRGTISFYPVVRYAYDVKGKRYESSTVTVIPDRRSSQWAGDIAARYAPGGVYTAYYDARDPTNAYLLHDSSPMPYFYILIALLWLAAAGIMVWKAGSGAKR
jgi:hypothetical protein